MTHASFVRFCAAAGPAAHAETLRLDLNGLQVGIDEPSGSIVRLAYPGVGTLLEAPPAVAGLLELTLAGRKVESRVVRASVTRTGTGVTILHSSLVLPGSPGKLSARADLSAAPDGRSAIFSCRITNEGEGMSLPSSSPTCGGCGPSTCRSASSCGWPSGR